MDSLFNPRSVAVIGASNRPFSPGNVIVKNLLGGDFTGTILPVNPKHASVSGILCYPDVQSLPVNTELAIICIEEFTSKALFQDLQNAGVKVAIVIANSVYKKQESEELQRLSRDYKVRVLGPNSLGLVLPWAQLNASLSPCRVSPGKIAFVSQSAAIGSTVLDWAREKNIGFSAYISIGSMADVSVSEVIDYLAMHSKTEAILIYVEHIKDARRFISAARSCARNKRILVLKGARNDAAKALSMQHHGGDKSLNLVYDSAFERCGLLRVKSTHELFAAAETLTHSVPLKGKRLAIITNGSGPGVIATDTLDQLGGKLAELSQQTQESLCTLTGHSQWQQNPVDISGDGQASKLVKAFDILMEDTSVDVILVMYSPSALADPLEVAKSIINKYKNHPHRRRVNLLTNWLGESSARQAREHFALAGIPTYRTPESSIMAFMHLVRYRATQVQLMETPISITKPAHQLKHTLELIGSEARTLSRDTTEKILEDYDINLTTQVSPIHINLIMYKDPTFGAVIAIGNSDEISDQNLTIGLPPLNQKLAQTLIKNALREHKISPLREAQFNDLTRNLVAFSQLVVDIPKLDKVSLAGTFSPKGVLSFVDGRIETSKQDNRLSIRPYPVELEQEICLKDNSSALIRPIRPEDEPTHAEFIAKVSKEDLYKRFFSDVGEFDHMAVANLTQIDYDREMALVAVVDKEIIGVSRIISDIRTNTAEFAVLIRSDKKGIGLGKILMKAAITHSQSKGLKRLEGVTMPTNRGMIGLAKALGFNVEIDFEEGMAEMKLILSELN